MANSKSKRAVLESKLSERKRKAALMLVEQEIGNGVGADDVKTQDEIADEVGVSRMTLYRWRTTDQAFLEYVNLLGNDFLAAHELRVHKRLMSLIDTDEPSVKAIELFHKLRSNLTERHEIFTQGNEGRSTESLAQELEGLEELLAASDENLD